MESREIPKLGQLSEAYEIIGEISGRTDARAFMARRKADNVELLVLVASQPEGDEGNALSHLAADANLLKGHRHRVLVPIVDALWVDDRFAIVTERPDGAPLEELLVRREEEFDFPRVAMILQELNGLLEWAREQKVVHRALGTDSVFLEPGSDRVMALFEVRPLPIADMPGPEDDAKTIARLARTMLTRSPMDPERESQPLDQLRPGLPASVVAQTGALLNGAVTDVPDIKAYIASIAMADALKRGETELANTIAQMREEERVAREKIEAEKNACVVAAQEQQRDFEKERSEIAKERERERAAITKERSEMAKERERERAAIAKEQEKERAALKRERDTIMAELAKERQSLLKVRDALERERSDLIRRATELEAQRDLYAKTQQFATPVGDAVMAAIPALPEIPELNVTSPRRVAPSRSRAVRERSWSLRGSRTLMVGAGALALMLLITWATIGRRPTGAVTLARAADSTLVDSAGGVSVSRAPDSLADLTTGDSTATFGAIGIPADFVAGVANRAALEPPRAIRRPRPRPPVDTFTARADTSRPDSLTRIDTTVRSIVPVLPRRVDTLGRPDTVLRRDTTRRDSLPRRDTVVRRDTIPPRDTLVRRDTLSRP